MRVDDVGDAVLALVCQVEVWLDVELRVDNERFAALAQEAPQGYPGQSNLVPLGMPTPTTAFERLSPGGPARDPGTLAWAQPGPYVQPNWTNFALRSFSSSDYIATTYYFYWHDLT